jgi:hypothetical protein
MTIRFIEPALIELDDAVAYYNEQVPGLGGRFFNSILYTIELIKKFPESWSKNSKNTRKAVMVDFTYNIIYSICKSEIIIIAVAHNHREPEYWIERIAKNI